MSDLTIDELFKLACQFDNLPEDTKFAVFSENNFWAKKYDKAVTLYFKYQQYAHQMIGQGG